MSQPSVIWWQPCVGNEGSIAALQNVAIGGNVILNSGKPGTPNTLAVFTYNKMIRSIIIDTAGNATFKVSGIGSPIDAVGNPTHILQPITEDIVVNAGGTESVNIYSQINSIEVTAAVAVPNNTAVGFGRFGITDYVFFGYNRISASLSSFSLQFIKPLGTSIKAGVFTSLNKPEFPNIAQGGVLEPFGTENGEYVTFIPAFQLIDPINTDPQLGQILGATCVTWATVKDTSLVIKDSLYFTFLQPGVSS